MNSLILLSLAALAANEPRLSIHVFDSTTKAPVSAALMISESPSGKSIETGHTDKDGDFTPSKIDPAAKRVRVFIDSRDDSITVDVELFPDRAKKLAVPMGKRLSQILIPQTGFPASVGMFDYRLTPAPPVYLNGLCYPCFAPPVIYFPAVQPCACTPIFGQ